MEKQKLIYSCEWPRNKETAWSGTDMAVRKRLDQYFDVYDFDYGIKRPYTFMTKVINKVFKKKIDVSKHYTKEFNHKYKDNNIIFQFGEVPLANIKTNKHFIYQDLSWNNVKDLKESDKDIFEISSYGSLNDFTILKNVARQNDFYNHDNAYCLTMGKWLAKYFIENLHIPQDRVCFVGGGLI